MKRRHVYRSPARPSLVVRLMRAGLVDVGLSTGTVFTCFAGRLRIRKQQLDDDGYCYVVFSVECKRGRWYQDRGRLRRRRHQCVAVHRLVKMKQLAVDAAGDGWRAVVCDLPLGVDVDHDDRVRSNNGSSNLVIKTAAANRGRREMTAEEAAAVEAFRRVA